jgi:hypothetical protein
VYPRSEGIPITVVFTSANSTSKQKAQTNSNGSYLITWKPDSMGLLQVHVNIAGNASISPAYSNTSTLTVNDTFLNQYLIFIIGGVGGVAGVAVVLFIRKRREE